jgi:hypothetical protein
MNNFATIADPFGALTIASFCQRYGIKRSFFYSEREAGRIAVRKAGKRVLVSVAEAERWFRGLPDPAEEPKRRRRTA